jgi:hypothetical protein
MTTPIVHPSTLLLPYDGQQSIGEQMTLANALAEANSGMPTQFRKDPGGVLAVILRARALNIPVMVAVDNLIIDGRGTCAMRARLMKALVTVRAGHRLVPIETTDKRAVVRLEYGDGRDPFTVEWTIATAITAGLIREKSPWHAYPANMLYWRAMAKAVALGCPEATLGIAVVEALDDDTDDTDDQPIEAGDIPCDAVVVPSSATIDVLNTLAIPDESGRPLVRDEIGIDDLRAAWKKQGQHGLSRFAWQSGECRFTLGQVLENLVEQVTARDKEKAAAEEESETNAETLETPAGTGVLPCGCDATTVVSTGSHRDGCRLAR